MAGETRRTLEVLLGFKDNLTPGTQKALSGLQKFSKKAESIFQGLTSRVFSLKTLLTGLFTGLVAREVEHQVEAVAELGSQYAKLSVQTGLSVETLSRLHHVAEETHVEFTDLAIGLGRFEKAIGDFQRGGGGAGDAIRLLGDSFREAVQAGEPAEKLFFRFIDAFGTLRDEEERVVVATELFARGGAQLIPLFAEGRARIHELAKESDELHLTWTRTEAFIAKDFMNALAAFKGSLKGLLEEIVRPLLPVFTDWFKSMREFVSQHSDQVLDFFAGLVEWGGKLADQVLPSLRSGFEGLFSAVKAVATPLLKVEEILAARKLSLTTDVVEQEEQRLARYRELLKGVQVSEALQEGFRTGSVFGPLQRAQADQKAALLEYEEVLRMQNLLDQGLGPTMPGSPTVSAAANAMRARAAAMRAGQGPGGAGGGEIFPGGGGAAASAWSGFYSGLHAAGDAIEKLRSEWMDTVSQMREGTRKVGESFVDDIGGELTKAELKTKSFGAAFRDMTKGILTDLLQIVNRMIIMRVLGFAIGAIGNLAGEIQAYQLGFQGTAPVAQHGTPRTRGPTIAGEAGAEAVIPLPDGRHVPVQILGGSAGGVTIYQFITTMDAKSFDGYWRESAMRHEPLVAELSARGFQASPRLRGKYH